MSLEYLTTPDDLGPCQVFAENLKAEVKKLRRQLDRPRCDNCAAELDDSEDRDGMPTMICPVCRRDVEITRLKRRNQLLRTENARLRGGSDAATDAS